MTISSEAGNFISAWLRSRPSHFVHRAAGIMMILIVVSIPVIQETPKNSLIARYRKAGFAALRADKPETAEIYFKRMGRLDPTDIEGRFGMALTAEKLGNLPLANRLMHGLAYGETTYPLAHNWLAEKILEEKKDDLSEDDFWRVRRHLEAAVADPTATVQAHAILGKMLMDRSEHHDAIPHLQVAADERPELRIPLARAYLAIGNQDDAAQEVDRAVNHFRAMSLASPGDAECCLIRVQCELMAGQNATADRVLRLARVRFPDDSRFTAVLQQMHFDATDKAILKGDFHRALIHLEDMLKIDPEAKGILERFATIAGSGSNVAESALNALRQVAATGKAPAAAHLAVGGVLLQRDDAAGAIYHFEMGLRHNPESVALLNNLAWCVSREKPAEHARALQLIERALERAEVGSKTRAEVLETRGQILARLGRYSEAAVAIETALPNLVDPIDAHATLATIYEQLGQDSMASLHRKSRTAALAEAMSNSKSRQ